MNKSEIFRKIKESLNDKEQIILQSMINGDSVVETAKNCAISVPFAQSYRKTVYEAVGQFVDFGNDKKQKQQILIDFMFGYELATSDKKKEPEEVALEDLKEENKRIYAEYEQLKESFDKLKERFLSNKSNFFVFNPFKDKPNKVYKNYTDAYLDAKEVAKISQNPVFVLRIDTLVVPHCKIETFDVVAEGISDNYLNQYNSRICQSGELLEHDEIPF